ncbi:dihydrofolate reductase family protein [Kribbella sp. NPDC059898]|uniref:dihydrofolate reductase family protein n=1 Tax=Kribbella sp. NPDC059898 TaxID=3346995 RepID=UPI00366446F5
MTNQRKVVAAYFLSLDGVAEKANEFLTGWDDETDAAGEQLIATQDTVLLGRRTYDEWAPYWPTSDIEPFASFVNAAPKYVATSHPLDDAWPNSHAIPGDLADFVRTLKSQPGADIGIHGSISVTRTLLAASLVDELHLVIAPTVVGPGQKLLDALGPIKLETIHGTKTSAGHILADYRVVR